MSLHRNTRMPSVTSTGITRYWSRFSGHGQSACHPTSRQLSLWLAPKFLDDTSSMMIGKRTDGFQILALLTRRSPKGRTFCISFPSPWPNLRQARQCLVEPGTGVAEGSRFYAAFQYHSLMVIYFDSIRHRFTVVLLNYLLYGEFKSPHKILRRLVEVLAGYRIGIQDIYEKTEEERGSPEYRSFHRLFRPLPDSTSHRGPTHHTVDT